MTPPTEPAAPSLLDSIRIGSPCTASWEAMRGDDRVRHCGQCRLDVYDLSALRRDEAETLLRGSSGRLCVRYTRRPDGRVVTDDCGRVRRAIRRRARAVRAAASALFALFFPLAAAGCGGGSDASAPPGGGTPMQGAPVPSVPPSAPPSAPPSGGPIPRDPVEMGDFCPPPEDRVLMGEMHEPSPPPAPPVPPTAPPPPSPPKEERVMGRVYMPQTPPKDALASR